MALRLSQTPPQTYKSLTRNSLIPILFLFFTGCVTVYNPATQKNESYFIDENSEIMIGKNIASDILRQNKVINDKSLTNYVKTIGQKIANASDRNYLQYNFYILDDNAINAFALPGGHVFINKGLLDKINEDELAFVLGHEIGHISARHSVKRLQTALGINMLVSVALQKPNQEGMRNAVGVVYNVISLGYSRQDELFADYLGTKYIYRAGYASVAAINTLEKLKKEKKSGIAIYFLRSHPSSDERIKSIEMKIDEIKASG